MNIKSFLLSLSVVVLFNGCVFNTALEWAGPAYVSYLDYYADDNKSQIDNKNKIN